VILRQSTAGRAAPRTDCGLTPGPASKLRVLDEPSLVPSHEMGAATPIDRRAAKREPVVGGPFWTLPNVISLTRVPLAVAAVVAVTREARVAAMVLMAASFLTDALDGTVARLTGSQSDWGRILDPLADKLVFAVFGLSFAWLGIIPWWLVAVIIGRDALVALGGALHMGRIRDVPSSNALGKASTVLLALYLFRQAFWPAEVQLLGLDWLGWAAVALLLLSTANYFAVYRRGLRSTT